ncbi:MAG: hypothetical protein GC179_25065 [Anaerolineaceae bacterium]|nr:hypothetical protein [Anaerolineaceae bacterium]
MGKVQKRFGNFGEKFKLIGENDIKSPSNGGWFGWNCGNLRHGMSDAKFAIKQLQVRSFKPQVLSDGGGRGLPPLIFRLLLAAETPK